MNCPKCNHQMLCPCPTCQKHRPTDKPWRWTEDGNGMSCGECNYTEHCDDWLDIAAKQYGHSTEQNKEL